MKVDPNSMEQVMTQAMVEELGALLDSSPWDPGHLRGKPGWSVHRFEHGLVVPTKDGPLALPYREVRIYREVTNNVRSGRTVSIYTKWVFQRGDGQVGKIYQSQWVGGGARDTTSALDGLCEQALAAACAEQREEVYRRVAEGATLSFGPVDVNLSQMAIHGLPGPWTEISSFSIDQGTLVVKVNLQSRWAKHYELKVKIALVPNYPLVWELLHALHRQAAPGR